jgi:hypothetical protein
MREQTLHKDEARPPAPICYICGGLGRPDSRDHVIPDCFFKSPRPANLLTLPAHYTCHNRFDDEYARDILSGLGSEGSDIAQELWNTKTKRSFERSAPLRKSFRESLVRKIDLTSPAGLVFDQAPALRIERDRFYPLMRKIVQGMYLYHTGEFLPPNFRSAWNLNAFAGTVGRQAANAGSIAVWPSLSGGFWLPLSHCE